MKINKTKYVLGFVFNTEGSEVLLIQKAKPDWQRNKFNGIGGKVEANETSFQAMERECSEETYLRHGDSIKANDWTNFCTFSGENFEVFVFCAFTEKHKDHRNILGKSATDEPTFTFKVSELPEGVIPNLRWLIPMALSHRHGEQCTHFQIYEGADA